MVNVHVALVALDKAGQAASAINAAQAKCAEALGRVPAMGSVLDAERALAEAQRLTSELGDKYLKAIETTLLALQAATPLQQPPQEPKPPATPLAVPPVDPGPLPVVSGCQIVDFDPRERPPYRMAGLYLRGQNMAVRFVTLPTASPRSCRVTSFEYRGEQRYRGTTISDKPCDFSGIGGETTSTQIFFTVGVAVPGHQRLEPGRTYYHNIRSTVWIPADGAEEFAMDLMMLPLSYLPVP